MNLMELMVPKAPPGVSRSQWYPQSRAQAERLFAIARRGNKDKHNPQKALRVKSNPDDPNEKGIIMGPGGSPTGQPSPEQARAMLTRVGIDPNVKGSFKEIDDLPLPEYSNSPDAQKKQDYLPKFGPRRRYGDGSRKVGGMVFSADQIAQARAWLKAAKQGDAAARQKLMNVGIGRFQPTRLGNKRIQTDSVERDFNKRLDEALGL